jgi:mannose-6-phosphate isomerase-like protein (cupin superfamily)
MKIIPKPWGVEEIRFKSDNTQFKILCIKHGHETSLQYHTNKVETIIPLDNNAIIEYGGTIDKRTTPNKKIHLHKGQMHVIIHGQIHRFIAYDGDTRLAELSNGLDSDIIRLDDKYNRK